MSDDEEEPEQTLETPGVMDKYQAAGKIVNSVLKQVMGKCVDGADVHEVCQFGHQEIAKQLKKVYKKQKSMEKGLAFPVCLSVNNVCGHFSPIKEDTLSLKNTDVVKIDLGVHIDGFIALAAHTVVVGSPPQEEESNEESKEEEGGSGAWEGRTADVVLAAHKCIQAAFRLMRPGNTNNQVTEKIAEICADYNVNPVSGVLSHELKKNLLDDNFSIINRVEVGKQEVEEQEFGINQVFGLDVLISTGTGMPKKSELRTTVYKRSVEKQYLLKSKLARQFFKEVIQNHPELGFSIGQWENMREARMGVSESLKHNLLDPYPVLEEKEGVVAQFKYTVMILKKQTQVIAGLNLDENQYKSEFSVTNQETQDLLKLNMSNKAQKKRAKMAQKRMKEEKAKQQKQETTTEEVKQDK